MTNDEIDWQEHLDNVECYVREAKRDPQQGVLDVERLRWLGEMRAAIDAAEFQIRNGMTDYGMRSEAVYKHWRGQEYAKNEQGRWEDRRTGNIVTDERMREIYRDGRKIAQDRGTSRGMDR